jgi:glycosyltransferase involved in cell wall biosynthesis
MRVLAIVPATMRAGSDVVRSAALGGVDVVVVNDGSTDETAECAREAAAA